MEQHPVPQHIASFEFKLFGNLTVRQFVTLAIPMAVAALIFFSGLPGVVRIPLSSVVGLFALFAALVPVGGRPFDKWVVAFIKAVLSPTQRVWVKEAKIPQFLSVVVSAPKVEEHAGETITAQGRERLKNYLRSLPKGEVTPLDVREQIAIQRLGLETLGAEGASGGNLPPPIIWPTSGSSKVFSGASVPQVRATVPVSMARKAVYEDGEFEDKLSESLPALGPAIKEEIAPKAPKINNHAKPFSLPGLDRKLKAEHAEENVEIAPPVAAHLASEANFTIENVIPIQTPGQRFRLIHGVGKTRARKLHFAPPEGFDLSKLPIRGERRFEISEELKRRFSDTGDELFTVADDNEKKSLRQQETIMPKRDVLVNDVLPSAAVSKKTEPVFKKPTIVPKPKASMKAAGDVFAKQEPRVALDEKVSIQRDTNNMPASVLGKAQMMPLTSTPNVISGVVDTQDGTPLEKVILVVKDSQGIPVRALKTNKLGQFLSATPLGSGSYRVEVESENHKFDPFILNLNGQVVEPFEVKAKN